IDAGEDFNLCSDEAWIHVQYEPLGEMHFEWQRNGELIPGENQNSLQISQAGVYTVTAYSSLGCSGSDSVTVSEGNGVVISNIQIGLDYIQIQATGGELPYEFSIDGMNWQS